MTGISRWKLIPLLVLMATSAACDRVVDSSKSVQTVTMRAFNDTKASWKDFFTYHPPQPPSLPQTRYCYQMQSDIVCYDSEQVALTSKLIGYQDGESISWVQPGGGSLGASGGTAVALRQVPHAASPTDAGAMIDTGPVNTSTSAIAVSPLPPAKKAR